MEEHRKKGSSRRASDRRGGHRRLEHRRKSNIDVDIERRKNVDQRKGYQTVSYTHLTLPTNA